MLSKIILIYFIISIIVHSQEQGPIENPDFYIHQDDATHSSRSSPSLSKQLQPDKPISRYYNKPNTLIPLLGLELGYGYNLLTSTTENVVLEQSFSLAKKTADDAWLIPDFVDSLATSAAEYDFTSSLYESIDKYSESINVQASGGLQLPSYGGTFSVSYSSLHEKMEQETNRLVRSEFTMSTYKLFANTILAKLSTGFLKVLEEINNDLNEGENDLAAYHTDRMLNLFGDSVIVETFVGGILVKEDVVNMAQSTSLTETDLSVTASAGFGAIFHADLSIGYNEQNVQQYNSMTSYSRVRTIGGKLSAGNGSLANFEDSVVDFPATVKRQVIPHYHLINGRLLPNMTLAEVDRLQRLLANRTQIHYDENSYSGCMDRNSTGYSERALVSDPNACGALLSNYTFMGVFSQVTTRSGDDSSKCDPYSLKNVFTGGFTCPTGVSPGVIGTQTVKFEWTETEFLVIKKKRSQLCIISNYVCQVDDSTGTFEDYQFGGVYSKTTNNVLTGSKSCGSGYTASSMVPTDTVTICTAPSTTQLPSVAGFGGLFSCSFPNPFALGGKSCPVGFEAHLIGNIEGTCTYYVCISQKSIPGLPVYTPPGSSWISPPTPNSVAEPPTEPEKKKVDSTPEWTLTPLGWGIIGGAIVVAILVSSLYYARRSGKTINPLASLRRKRLVKGMSQPFSQLDDDDDDDVENYRPADVDVDNTTSPSEISLPPIGSSSNSNSDLNSSDSRAFDPPKGSFRYANIGG